MENFHVDLREVRLFVLVMERPVKPTVEFLAFCRLFDDLLSIQKLLDVDFSLPILWIVVKRIEIVRRSLDYLAFYVRMPELGSVLSFELGELFEEPRYLEYYYEQVTRSWGVLHVKHFQSFVVLVHRVITLALKRLPISAQVILGKRIENEQKVLNVRNSLFQEKMLIPRKIMVSLLHQTSNCDWGSVKSISYLNM